MKFIAVFIGILLVSSIRSADAYFDTGNTLFAYCEGPTPSVGVCVGTIVGHYDMMMALGYDCGNDTTKTKQQLRDIVVKYLKENPAQRNDTAASLSFVAFMFAFDCKFPDPQPPKK